MEEDEQDNVVGSKNEIDRLSKLNFNMKLRIFYLEERLSKLNSNTSDDSEDLAQENLDLKMLVEEKQRDLEDRNQLLVKARNAIEGLQTENTLVKAELAEQRNKSLPTQALVVRDKEIQSLKEENEKLVKIHDEQKAKMALVEKELKRNQTEVKSNEVVVSDLQIQLQLAKSEITAQKNLVQTLEATETAARKKSCEEAKTREQLEKQVERLEEALTEALTAKSSLESQILEMETNLQTQKEREANEVTSHQGVVRELTTKCNTLESQLERQRKEFVNTVVTLETKDKHLEALDKDIERLRMSEAQKAEIEVQLKSAQEAVTMLERQCKEQAIQLEQNFRLERSADRVSHDSQRKELQAQLKYMEEQYAQTATQLEAEKTRCKELQGDCATATAKVSKLCEENAVLAERFKSLKRESGVKEDSLRLHAQTLADERVRQLESAIHEKQAQLQVCEQTISDLRSSLRVVEASTDKDKHDLEDAICNKLDVIMALPKSLPLFDPGKYQLFDETSSYMEKQGVFGNSRVLRKLSQVEKIYNVLSRHLKDFNRRLEVQFAKLEASVQGKENRIRNVEVQMSIHSHTKTRENQGVIQEHALILSQLRQERQKALEDLRECERERENAMLESQRVSLELANLQRKMEGNESSLERLKLSAAEEVNQLKESNRLMSLELEDRRKRLEMCRSSAENATHEIQLLKQETELKDTKIEELKLSLDQKRKQLRSQAKKLKGYSQFVNTTAQAHTKMPDDFERNILEQVRETERAIVLSNDQRRENELVSNSNLLEQIKRSEERFADVMLAASELVGRCEHQFVHASNAQPGEIRKIFHSNALLASQLQDLGFEVQTLFRKIGRLERMDAGRLSYKNSPLRMFSTPRKWKATDPEGIENNAQNEYKETSYAQLYETPLRKSTLKSNVSTVEKLHKDMLVRLGKIGNDLQATAAALRLT